MVGVLCQVEPDCELCELFSLVSLNTLLTSVPLFLSGPKAGIGGIIDPLLRIARTQRIPIWAWAKTKPPGIGPKVVVLVSIRDPFWRYVAYVQSTPI